MGGHGSCWSFCLMWWWSVAHQMLVVWVGGLLFSCVCIYIYIFLLGNLCIVFFKVYYQPEPPSELLVLTEVYWSEFWSNLPRCYSVVFVGMFVFPVIPFHCKHDKHPMLEVSFGRWLMMGTIRHLLDKLSRPLPLFAVCKGLYYLLPPSYIGFMISHSKDPGSLLTNQ